MSSNPKYIYPPEFELVSSPTIKIDTSTGTDQTVYVKLDTSPNGTMYQQYDILQLVQDQARKAMEVYEDNRICQALTGKTLDELRNDRIEEKKHLDFQNLCAKIRKKYSKK